MNLTTKLKRCINFYLYLGTKTGEYLLNIDNGKMVKEDFDPLQKTLAQNTVKFSRCLRNKVENKYGGVKQKYQLMRIKIPIYFLPCVINSSLYKV